MLRERRVRTNWLIFLSTLFPIIGIHFLVERSDSLLIPLYSMSFVGYVLMLTQSKITTKDVIVFALLARVVLFFGWPLLSDDFYRFIWDGRMWMEGLHPFSALPSEVMIANGTFTSLNNELYSKLNSPDYYTIYPPLSQLIFYLSNLISGHSIFINMSMIRLFILFFETGTFYVLYKLTSQGNPKLLAIYALNPLVILELTGNLHFEGVVIFFTLLSIWLFKKEKYNIGATGLAAGIAFKLTPLMYLAAILRKIGFKNAIITYFVIAIFLIVVSIPFFDYDVLEGMSNSLSLFFRSFEFNAGIFFMIGEFGYYFVGYDIVQTAGPVLSAVSLLLILSYSFGRVKKETSWEQIFTVILFLQLIFATTVHPWYIIPLIAYACLTKYTFPLIWSYLIFLTYLGYSLDGYSHPFGIVYIEYLVVLTVASYELIKQKPLLKYV